MPTCNICLANVTKTFSPKHRPNHCICIYSVHEKCFTTWLNHTNQKYKCIICDTSIPITEEDTNMTVGVRSILYLIIIKLIYDYYNYCILAIFVAYMYMLFMQLNRRFVDEVPV